MRTQPMFQDRSVDTRLFARKAIDADVMLYNSGIPVMTCKCRDIALEGAFIASGPVDYPCNTLLEIEFVTVRYGFPARLKAIVVHRTYQGVGLMFTNLGVPELLAITALLQPREDAHPGRNSVCGDLLRDAQGPVSA